MCSIFMMCFVLFLFVACFGWNFNSGGYMATAAAAAVYVRGKCCCYCWLRERKLVVLWREVEIRNRKKQGKHKTNGEINEQIAIKKLNDHDKLGGGGGGLFGCNYD